MLLKLSLYSLNDWTNRESANNSKDCQVFEYFTRNVWQVSGKVSDKSLGRDKPSLRSKCFCGVGEQRKSEEWHFQHFARARYGERAKNRKEGEGKEGTACRKSPAFWKPPTWPFMSECAHKDFMLSSAVRTFEDLSKHVRNIKGRTARVKF